MLIKIRIFFFGLIVKIAFLLWKNSHNNIGICLSVRQKEFILKALP